jgi:hypothetical protein
MHTAPRWATAVVGAAMVAVTALACGPTDRATVTDTDAVLPATIATSEAPQRAVREESLQLSSQTAADGGIVGGGAAMAPPAPPPMAAEAPRQAFPRATSQAVQLGTEAALVIRSGGARIEVDSLDHGVARVRQLVQAIPGAYVADMSMEGGRDQPRRATLQVKVPAPAFDRLIAGLAPLGKVEAVNVTAEDVSEEFVDLTARAANARRLEERLVDLLARRTGKLQDVLAVERELARVREEIERHDGRLRYLRTHAAVSTLAITVHEPTPLLGGPRASSPIGEAFRQSWRNFVSLVAALIAVSGVLVPVAVVGYVAWRLLRRFHRATAAPATTAAPAS